MSIEKNIQTVKDFFAAIGRGDKEGLLALVADLGQEQVALVAVPLLGGERLHRAAALQTPRHDVVAVAARRAVRSTVRVSRRPTAPRTASPLWLAKRPRTIG